MRLVAVLVLAAVALGGAGYSSLVALNLPAPTIAPRLPGPPPEWSGRQRVLVVVIDGLGADVAAELPALQALARRGARGALLAEPPTFSSPQYVAFLTGVGPVDSGVRTNLRPRRTPLDSVVAAVRRRGGRAVQVGDEVDWWGRFFAWDEALVVAPERLLAEARRLIADARNRLVLVHIVGVDQAGHASGAASPAYREAAAAAASQLQALSAIWNERDPLVVLSDHGHMPAGGHGGSQDLVRRAFLVMAGPGVRPGVTLPDAHTSDVGPTLAALLGLPAPAESTGTAILGALEMDQLTRTSHARAEAARLALVGDLAAAGRWQLAQAERRAQLVRGLVVLAAVVAAGWWIRRVGRAAARGLLHGAAATALLALLVWMLAGELSFASFRHLKQLGLQTGLLALGAALVALAGPLRAALLGRLPPSGATALAGGAAIGASPLAVVAFVLAGVTGPRFSCRPDWLAAGPTMAYLALAPILICAAAVVLAARRGASH